MFKVTNVTHVQMDIKASLIAMVSSLVIFFVKKFKNCINWKFFFLKECNCDKDGSSTFVCNKATGQCTCKTLVVGLTCNKCDDGYYDFPNPCKRN